MSRSLARLLIGGLLVSVSACDAVPEDGSPFRQESAVQSPDIQPNGRGIGTMNRFQKGEAGKPAGGNNGILYHGGPLMLGTVHVYYIWYGAWAGNSAQTILTDLAGSIGGSPYYNINTSYANGAGVAISNSVSYA